MEITLSRVVEAARQRRAAVTAEVGGYIVLLTASRLAAHPSQVIPEQIGLSSGGEVLLGSGVPADPLETERGLRQLLGLLLGLSHSAPPALAAASERVATGNLAAFEAELLAALIPLNHGASGRALARLFRETQRALSPRPSAEPGAPEQSSPSPAPVSAGAAETSAPAALTPVAKLEALASAALTPVAKLRTPAPDALTPVAKQETPAPATAAPPSVAKRETPAPAPRATPPPAPSRTTPAPASAVRPSSGFVMPLPRAFTPTPALPSFVGADSSAELEIDVDVDEDILLGDAAESEADDVDVSVAELDVSSAELDVLLAADVAETTPAPALFALSDTPSLPGSGLEDAEHAQSPLPDACSVLEDAEPVESPLPDACSVLTHVDLELPPQRSDLRELLNGYLAHTRSAANMTADLRRRVGL